jgi:hypothetical protein
VLWSEECCGVRSVVERGVLWSEEGVWLQVVSSWCWSVVGGFHGGVKEAGRWRSSGGRTTDQRSTEAAMGLSRDSSA